MFGPAASQYLDFPRHMVWSCLCSMIWGWEVIVRFVDIGRIVDHERLTFFSQLVLNNLFICIL
jgi:hypothetical protein